MLGFRYPVRSRPFLSSRVQSCTVVSSRVRHTVSRGQRPVSGSSKIELTAVENEILGPRIKLRDTSLKLQTLATLIGISRNAFLVPFSLLEILAGCSLTADDPSPTSRNARTRPSWQNHYVPAGNRRARDQLKPSGLSQPDGQTWQLAESTRQGFRDHRDHSQGHLCLEVYRDH